MALSLPSTNCQTLFRGCIALSSSPLARQVKAVSTVSHSADAASFYEFFAVAAMIDLELSCATALASIIKLARASEVPLILSRHDFKRMPSVAVLRKLADRAHSLGADIFKIVARTDDRQQLEQLLAFAQSKSLPMSISAMGVGKLGRVSRAILATTGSVLNYAHLGRATAEGQMSLSELRAVIRRRQRSGKSRGTRRAYI